MRDGVKHVFQKPAAAYEPRGRLDPAGFERHVRFETRQPPPDLAPFIEHFWIVAWNLAHGAYNSVEVMHRPYVDVFVSPQQSGIQGTFRRTRTYLAAGSGRIVGARFLPGGFHAFWSGEMADLHEKVADLRELFPKADDGFVQHVSALDDDAAVDSLVELVRSKHPRPDANIDLINRIIAAIEAEESLDTVAAVAEAFCRSERRIQQLFRDYAGIGLKWLLQRHRLLAAARRIRESEKPDWADIAYEFGYASQQHFNTDFKKVLGRTPMQYKKAVTRSEG
jgi:AraC-like DNA-binding protein